MKCEVSQSRKLIPTRASGLAAIAFAVSSANAFSYEVAAVSGEQIPAKTTSEVVSDEPTNWYMSQISLLSSKDMRYAPKPIDDTYLEYEYFGQVGPLSLYGYVDVPKVLGIGSSNDKGAWDDGSPVFMEHMPRLSLNKLFGSDARLGFFKEFYVALDWVYDHGDNRDSRSNVLYSGVGADIDTKSDLILQFNLYGKRAWQNYRMTNENSWDGYRVQLNFSKPLATFEHGGALNLDGSAEYDFGSKLDEKDSYTYTDSTFNAVGRLLYTYKHFTAQAQLSYFKDGANYRDHQVLDYGDGSGPFTSNTSGFGYVLGIGYLF